MPPDWAYYAALLHDYVSRRCDILHDHASRRSPVRSLRLTGAATALACSVLLALVGCGGHSNTGSSQGTTSSASAMSSPSSGTAACQHVGSVHFDKTKFVFHAGLAFGAFHHFIYKPYKAGAFASGTHGRVTSLVKAALAAAFTVHELKLAKQDAESSPTLCHLAAPFDEAAAGLSGLTHKLHSGSASDQDINGVASKIDSTQQGASQAGVPAPDRVPSGGQLANPPS